MIPGEDPDRGNNVVGIERMSPAKEIVKFGEEFFCQLNLDRFPGDCQGIPPGMNLYPHALFDELQMAVVLPEEELDRTRVIEMNPAGGMVLGLFFQISLVSWG